MDLAVIGGGAVAVIVLVIVIVSIIVGKKRKQEVEELDKIFPTGSMSSDNIKISVEKVRRTTMERERRQKKQHIHRERPKKGEKTLPYEDQEIIYRDHLEGGVAGEMNEADQADKVVQESPRASRVSKDKFKPRGKNHKSGTEEVAAVKESAFKKDKPLEKSFAVRKQTRKSPRDESEISKELGNREEHTDAATNRRLYKRSLLASGENRETNPPKASLIDTQMYAAEDEVKEEKPTLSRSQAKSGRSWFKK